MGTEAEIEEVHDQALVEDPVDQVAERAAEDQPHGETAGPLAGVGDGEEPDQERGGAGRDRDQHPATERRQAHRSAGVAHVGETEEVPEDLHPVEAERVGVREDQALADEVAHPEARGPEPGFAPAHQA